jgi:CDP-diglyceride synthetase
MGDSLYPAGGLWVFLALTIVLGGAAAWAAGRAVARTWRSPFLIPLYVVGLAAAVHFLHYALFGEPFVSLHYYCVDYIVLALAAGAAYRWTRARQMVQQYNWVYCATGNFFWREKAALSGLENENKS